MTEQWEDYDNDPDYFDGKSEYSPFENHHCCNGCGDVYNDYEGTIIDATTHQPHTCSTATERDLTMEDILGKLQPTTKENKMFSSVKVISRPSPRGINAVSLNVGEYARVVGLPGDLCFGHIILKTLSGVVDISDPNSAWPPFAGPEVERLNTGDKLEITIGFTAQVEQEIRNLRVSNKISAIKKVREITNWGLKESKDYVDAL